MVTRPRAHLGDRWVSPMAGHELYKVLIAIRINGESRSVALVYPGSENQGTCIVCNC